MKKEEFLNSIKKFFDSAELKEIDEWFDDCRNAFIMGVFDRRYRGKGTRRLRTELVKFLDANPDKFTLKLRQKFGVADSVAEQVKL